jgi:hypothetical protein
MTKVEFVLTIGMRSDVQEKVAKLWLESYYWKYSKFQI